MHLNFGIDMINQIKFENSDLWDNAFQVEVKAMIHEATNHEKRYPVDAFPRGILRLNASIFK